MKRLIFLFLLLASVITASAQSEIRYGYVSLMGIASRLPEYKYALEQVSLLRQKYEAEAEYNETAFRQQFNDYLHGQKDFPQNILLKRQRDLQELMEKSLAFRQEADSIIAAAREEFLQPIRQRISEAVREVGLEHGYEFILDTDTGAYPFIHPSVGEDATDEVLRKLGIL